MAYSPSRGLLYTDPEPDERTERETPQADAESVDAPAPADD